MFQNRFSTALGAVTPLCALTLISSAPCQANIDGMSRKEEVHRYLYRIYSFQKRYPEAEKEVAAVTALAPKDAKIQGEFGHRLLEENLYKDAYPHLVRATELEPCTAAYWANRGACEMQLGRYQDAVKSFRKSVQYQKGQENYKPQLNLMEQYNQRQLEIEKYKWQQEHRQRDDDE